MDEHLKMLNETLEQRVAERTAVISLLHDVASAANKSGNVEELLWFTLQRVAQHWGWCYGHAFLLAPDDSAELLASQAYYEARAGRFATLQTALSNRRLRPGQALPGRVLQTGSPQWTTQIEQELQTRQAADQSLEIASILAFPVPMGDEVVAVLEFFAEQPFEPDASVWESMESIGTQIGRVIERKQLAKQIAEATAREKRNVGQELHDSVAQQLTGVGMLAESLRQRLVADQSTWADNAAMLVQYIQDAQRQVRQLSRGLMPVEVDANGLMSALHELTVRVQESQQVVCNFQCDQPVPLKNTATATHLYRIAQEAIQNAVKHAHARQILVSLQFDDDQLTLAVRDDGVGIATQPQTAPPRSAGMGCHIMRYRAELIGAQLEVRSAAGQGTSVLCTLKANQSL